MIECGAADQEGVGRNALIDGGWTLLMTLSKLVCMEWCSYIRML
ncbi:hypothetical protein [Algoriphagus antarcticus]|uniref:Uncharacterized protein n=1 Tax=Algoriphagus antarcticus TaxID=238540 RepID=A0A3E0DAK9_9BACT|nr:hypothetical protein [Algoriphagus antarcticus]REG79607.1 hypothetical protein C8N25_13044 [Algoriphagus antarcticus]